MTKAPDEIQVEYERLLQTAIDKTGIPREELIRLINREFKDGELPRFMKLANIPFAEHLVEEIKAEVKRSFEGLRSDLRERVNDTFRIILYNLVKCSLTRERLSLPSSKGAYEGDSHYKKMHFTRRSVEACLKALKPYLTKKTGNTYKHKVNSYAPNELFQLRLIPLIYLVYEEYSEDTELIIIQDKRNKENDKIIYTKKQLENYNNRNNKNSEPLKGVVEDNYRDNNNKHIMRVRSSIELERTYVEDLEQLIKINDALKDATYALKAPIKRIYSRGTVMHGGRLYTPLANLPDRRARIRINTLFNGNPVAEVDLKANHSSMLYAGLGKQLPKDFYQQIANASGVSRDKVKWLVMKMIGAKDRSISLTPDIDEQNFYKSKFLMTHAERRLIEDVITRLFPDLYAEFYQDRGVWMQAMEGDILLDAMCDLIDRGILSLPIHDALYVEKQNIAEAEKALKASWKKNLNVDFEPFVDVDFP